MKKNREQIRPQVDVETENEEDNGKTERVRQFRRRREAKAQHSQTYGCLLLDYTSAGWKITSSVCICASVCVLLHMLVNVSKSSYCSLLKITRYHLTCVCDAYLRLQGSVGVCHHA